MQLYTTATIFVHLKNLVVIKTTPHAITDEDHNKLSAPQLTFPLFFYRNVIELKSAKMYIQHKTIDYK